MPLRPRPLLLCLATVSALTLSTLADADRGGRSNRHAHSASQDRPRQGAAPAAESARAASPSHVADDATTAARVAAGASAPATSSAATPKNATPKNATPKNATPKQAAKPNAGKPAKPTVGKPAKPAVGKPAKPAAGKPAKPTAGKPAKPAAAKPSKPAAGKPTKPKAAKPKAAKPAKPKPAQRPRTRAEILAAQAAQRIRQARLAAAAQSRTLAANPEPGSAVAPNPYTSNLQVWRRPSIVRALLNGTTLPAIIAPDVDQRADKSHAGPLTANATSAAVTPRPYVRTPFDHPHAVPAARPAPKKAPVAAPGRAPQQRPGYVGAGHYIRSLTGSPPHDHAVMYDLGARDAARNPAGRPHLVLLDIGGQVRNGVLLSTTQNFIDYGALRRALFAYIDGYHAQQHDNAPVTIAIGTNNDLVVTATAGKQWALEVVDPVANRARRYPNMTIAGADDIEPGFRAGVLETRAWLNAYLGATSAPFIFNGSADGCAIRPLPWVCNGGWSTGDLAWFAGSRDPGRITALPQIYNSTMAVQWALIARTAIAQAHRPLHILGPLTENAACGSDPSCPTMPSSWAWAALWQRLHLAQVPVSGLPMQVDLDVH